MNVDHEGGTSSNAPDLIGTGTHKGESGLGIENLRVSIGGSGIGHPCGCVGL